MIAGGAGPPPGVGGDPTSWSLRIWKSPICSAGTPGGRTAPELLGPGRFLRRSRPQRSLPLAAMHRCGLPGFSEP